MEKFGGSAKIEKKTGDSILSRYGEKLTSLVSSIKEKYPNFTKVIETAEGITRILTVVVMLHGGELLAKDIKEDAIKKDEFSLQNMEIQNMTISEIDSSISSVKHDFPDGKELTFSKKMQQKDREGTETSESLMGTIPIEIGSIGENVEIISETYKIDKLNGAPDEESSYKNFFSLELKLSKDFTYNQVVLDSEDKDTIKIHGFEWKTKEDAVLDALDQLSKKSLMHASCKIYSSIEGSNQKNDIIVNSANVILINTNNFFKNVSLDRIEEKKEGGKTTYVAHISAQRGRLQVPDAVEKLLSQK